MEQRIETWTVDKAGEKKILAEMNLIKNSSSVLVKLEEIKIEKDRLYAEKTIVEAPLNEIK